jgi:hypothetical protein
MIMNVNRPTSEHPGQSLKARRCASGPPILLEPQLGVAPAAAEITRTAAQGRLT